MSTLGLEVSNKADRVINTQETKVVLSPFDIHSAYC